MIKNLFPLGVAEGEAFCNRVNERKELSSNINHGVHTVLIGPRRYGKSSLVRKVISDMNIPYAWIDFLTVSTKEEVQAQIAKLVTQAIYAISPDVKKIQAQVNKVFKGLTSEINFGVSLGKVFSTSISLHPNFEKELPINEILMKLDELAMELDTRIVFVFDEFQQISMLKDSGVIEGMIRHAVERSKAVTYIFSGSNRHLLSSMFSSKDRPLYRLCMTMQIERIAESDYKAFLNDLAQQKWGQSLPEDTFIKIMECSERHPFYVNALCSQIWRLSDAIPEARDIEKVWFDFIEVNKNNIISEVLDLSINQKRVLNCLAQEPVQEIRGKEFLLKVKLPPSSIVQAIEALESKDLIFKSDAGFYKLLDPAVRYYVLLH